jgi:flagellar basal body-associated protein FliL
LAEDISRKAVLILVILAVTISVLSTSFVISAVYNFNPETNTENSVPVNRVPTGRVTLTVPDNGGNTQGVAVLTVPE